VRVVASKESHDPRHQLLEKNLLDVRISHVQNLSGEYEEQHRASDRPETDAIERAPVLPQVRVGMVEAVREMKAAMAGYPG